MKKLLAVFAVAVVSCAFVFAGGASESADSSVLRVGASPEPHGTLLNLVVDNLAEEGITLEIVEFTDYIMPNEALESGEIDANYFQHLPYLESFNVEHGYNLVSAGGIHIEPMALYSTKHASIEDIPDGATIAIPNDPTNEGRALLLLESAGLITLSEDAGIEAVPSDVVDNPHNFRFSEIEAASLPRVLDDADAAVINGNYAIPAGLIATRDGLYVEGGDSPYVNVIAVKAGNENNEAVQALVEALKSDEVADFVAQNYPNGEVILGFFSYISFYEYRDCPVVRPLVFMCAQSHPPDSPFYKKERRIRSAAVPERKGNKQPPHFKPQ